MQVVPSEFSKSTSTNHKANANTLPTIAKKSNSPKQSPMKNTSSRIVPSQLIYDKHSPTLTSNSRKPSNEGKSASELVDRKDSFLIVQNMKKMNIDSTVDHFSDFDSALPTSSNASHIKHKSPLLTSATSNKPSFPSPPIQGDLVSFPVIK